MKKYAVITMDVEDWYHCDYFFGSSVMDENYHTLDGLDVMIDILKKNNVYNVFPASFLGISSITITLNAAGFSLVLLINMCLNTDAKNSTML